MALTREEADKIEIDEDVIVGFSGSGGDICAEQLAKWAYRRLETWPDLLDTLRYIITLSQPINGKWGRRADKICLTASKAIAQVEEQA